MSTRKTQNLIIQTAIDLFNEHGTKAISTNRIANECHLSRGNLYYHFRTKEEIIQTIFQRIDQEMSANWLEDHLHPTMKHMYFMFARQIKTIWQYHFFYREINSLLQNDARLKILFMDNRRKRRKEVLLFFEALVQAELLINPVPPSSLESIVQITWLISDQWMPHLDMHDRPLDELGIGEGYRLILQVLQPYFTQQARQQQQALLTENKVSGGAIFGATRIKNSVHTAYTVNKNRHK